MKHLLLIITIFILPIIGNAKHKIKNIERSGGGIISFNKPNSGKYDILLKPLAIKKYGFTFIDSGSGSGSTGSTGSGSTGSGSNGSGSTGSGSGYSTININAGNTNICDSGLLRIEINNTSKYKKYWVIDLTNNKVISDSLIGNGGTLYINTSIINSTRLLGLSSQNNTGASMYFDGTNDYLTATGSIDSSKGTWEAWVQKDYWTHNDDILFGNNLPPNNVNSFYISLHPAVGFHFRYSNGPYDFADNIASQSFANNSWHHLAATWHKTDSNTTMKLYVDGVYADSGTSTKNLSFGNNIFIGGNNTYFGAGKMDDIRVWNFAKSETQLQTEMNNCELTDTSGLVYHWNFNESIEKSFVKDVSASSKNLILNNMDTINNWQSNKLDCLYGDTIILDSKLIVNIGNPNTSDVYITHCASALPYTRNGIDYYTAGNYSTQHTNLSGCDSTERLHLSINDNEIEVEGNNTLISDNDVTPDASDSTDFGTVNSPISVSYKIFNTGNYPLAISNIQLSGANASDFNIVHAIDTIFGLDSAQLQVVYTPNGFGIRNATVNIFSNNCDIPNYNFDIIINNTKCPISQLTDADTMKNTLNDSNWMSCSNWHRFEIPDSMTDVVIDAGKVATIKSGQILKCHNLTILNGGKLLMKCGVLKIYGNIYTEQAQALFADSGTIVLSGTDTNKILDCIPRIFNLEINKPSGIVLLDLYGGLEIKNNINFIKGIVRKTSIGLGIEIMNGGSSSEGNPQSFAACRVQKYGNTDFIFPVGKANKWARCAISNFTGSTCGAEYFIEGYGNYDTTAPLNNVSVNEYWDIGTDGGSADVSLHWENIEFSGIDLSQNPNDLRVAHFNYDYEKWEDMGNTANSFNNQGWVTSANVNNFSPFTFGSLTPAIPLPVNFISFTAKKASNNTALIKWQTASEINNSHFEIERSLDGKNFIKIGTKNANGNANKIQNYQYIDNTISGGAIKAFYRIKQVDNNGKSTITNVQLVNFNQVNNGIAIYPNPASSILNISLPAETEKATVTITDAMGKLVHTAIVGVITNNTIDLSSFSIGIYSINITSETETKNIKLLKQ